MKYLVTRESNNNQSVVIAESAETAALRGAIKLGIRYQLINGGRRKPTMVNSINGGNRFATYCYDPALNASNNVHEPVYVENAD